jgi:hypothetical protein
MSIKSFNSFNEAKGEKWIQDAIKNPGALKKSMGKKEDEKISKSEINAELAKLKAKDKDPKKPGAQLDKKDATKKRRLELAKTLRSLKEHQETDNYMFFGNLATMKRLIDELLTMDESQIDAILNEHDWASDHISVATENLEQVFDFLAGHNSPEHDGFQHEEEPMGEPMSHEFTPEEEPIMGEEEKEEGVIKSYQDFQS